MATYRGTFVEAERHEPHQDRTKAILKQHPEIPKLTGYNPATFAFIVALTLVQAAELARYGITSNAIAPSARTRMTEEAFAEEMTSKGREIGYAIPATCDEPRCAAEIDRGLAYARGGMHGQGGIRGDVGCEGYFCFEYRQEAPRTPL